MPTVPQPPNSWQESFSHITSGIQAIFQTVAIIVGGWWAYKHFVLRREAYPKIDFSVDINFVKKQNGFWVAEALAFVGNKGLVKHSMHKFIFSIRYMLPSDPVEKKGDFLVYLPHEADSGSWLPSGWGHTFVEPGAHTRYSCLIRLPEQATVALIHGKFYYENKSFHTADKLVSVPSESIQRSQS